MTMLVVFGGFAGTGKTTISRRLSSELCLPCLSSDSLRRVIGASSGINGGESNAGWIAYDVLFHLCEEFLDRGVSTIIDTNLGHAFQWHWLDGLRERRPAVAVLPILLHCPLEVCLARIQVRYESDPLQHAPSDLFTTDANIVSIWDYLTHLDRPDLHWIDATRPLSEVYDEVRAHVHQSSSWSSSRCLSGSNGSSAYTPVAEKA
jgi:predicted kinase